MRWLWLTFTLTLISALPSFSGELHFDDDDPRSTKRLIRSGQSAYRQSLPKDSYFWKVDSDGSEWRKDSYGTIWKKDCVADPFSKAAWSIDGFDNRQARRIGMDTIVQYKLNLDGTIKPESVRQSTWIANVDPDPTTLPLYMQKANYKEGDGKAASLAQERPKLIPQGAKLPP